MIDNFNLDKAKQFIEKTKQSPFILRGAYNSNSIDEMNIINNIDDYDPQWFLFHTYYDQEQLYCKLMRDNEYWLPFTLEELNAAFQLLAIELHQPNKRLRFIKTIKSRKLFNRKAYEYVKLFNSRYSC